MKQRYRNYGLWVSLVSQGLLAAQAFSSLVLNYTITQEMSTGIVVLANAILLLLSTLGIISNPTKPDDKGFNL